MDSVSHLPGFVMEAQTALMAVMNSTAVSTCTTLSSPLPLSYTLEHSTSMDSVFLLPIVVMETRIAEMAVVNATATNNNYALIMLESPLIHTLLKFCFSTTYL